MIELMLVLGIAATMTGAAVPGVARVVARYRTTGAVYAVRSTLQRARAAAVARSANVAVRFSRDADGVRFALYADGNRNGVSAADIASGADPELEPPQTLGPFGGPTFGIWPGTISPDGSAFTSVDPIRVGGASMISFSPSGGATAGSLYITGPGGLQYAIRVYGDTGKTQVVRYVQANRTWEAE